MFSIIRLIIFHSTLHNLSVQKEPENAPVLAWLKLEKLCTGMFITQYERA